MNRPRTPRQPASCLSLLTLGVLLAAPAAAQSTDEKDDFPTYRRAKSMDSGSARRERKVVGTQSTRKTAKSTPRASETRSRRASESRPRRTRTATRSTTPSRRDASTKRSTRRRAGEQETIDGGLLLAQANPQDGEDGAPDAGDAGAEDEDAGDEDAADGDENPAIGGTGAPPGAAVGDDDDDDDDVDDAGDVDADDDDDDDDAEAEAEAGGIKFRPRSSKYEGQRIDITPGDIPVEEFVRFISDYTGLDVIYTGGAAAGGRASPAGGREIKITSPILNVDGEMAKAILESNGYKVEQRKLSTGRELLEIGPVTANSTSATVRPVEVVRIDDEGNVSTAEDAVSVNNTIGVAPDEIATLVFTLKHVEPKDAISSLNNLVTGTAAKTAGRNSDFTATEVGTTQTIIVTAKFGLLDYILKLLKIIDVPSEIPQRYVDIIEVKEAEVGDLVGLIEDFLSQKATGGSRSRNTARATPTSGNAANRTSNTSIRRGTANNEFETSLIADERTQKIIITTYDTRDLEDINMLIRELDIRFDIRRLKTRIYRMKFLKAVEVAPVIADIIGSSTGGRSGTSGVGRNTRGGTGRTPRTTGSRGISNPGSTGAGQGLLPTLIVAHEETNSLIVQAEPEEYSEILHILEQIDVKRRQVFLEAALVQVAQSSALNYTIELLAGDPDDRDTRLLFEQSFGLSGIDTENFNRIFDLTTPPAGGILAVMDRGKFPALVSFLKSNQDSEVLATPFILADDNVPSDINITETRFVQNTATGTNGTTTSSQQGEDAGIRLNIFPTINSENSVFLELELEVSEFGQASVAGVLPPKTTNSITSSVTIAGDGIYVIGGLTRSNRSKVVSKLPLLGDIPILGKLFRSEGDSESLTNLYIFLRAHILTDRNFQDLRQLTAQAEERVKAMGSGVLRETMLESPTAGGRAETDTIDRDEPQVYRRNATRRAVAPGSSRRGRDNSYRLDPEDPSLEPLPGGFGTPRRGSADERDLPSTDERGNRQPGLPSRTGDGTGASAARGPSSRGTGSPSSKAGIPADWSDRGLEVDSERPSWFIPINAKEDGRVSSG